MNPGEHIRQNAYVEERLHPKRGRLDYLPLADLRMALEAFRTDRAITILDYGCGGSTYRSLFPNAIYKRADYLQDGVNRLDYVLSEDSRVKEADNKFDFILSTQVLEHVGSPTIYLAECFRLLKSGGTLYITTHGTFPDHACPYDFYRWTTDGLTRDIRCSGFCSLPSREADNRPKSGALSLGLPDSKLKDDAAYACGSWYVRI